MPFKWGKENAEADAASPRLLTKPAFKVAIVNAGRFDWDAKMDYTALEKARHSARVRHSLRETGRASAIASRLSVPFSSTRESPFNTARFARRRCRSSA